MHNCDDLSCIHINVKSNPALNLVTLGTSIEFLVSYWQCTSVLHWCIVPTYWDACPGRPALCNASVDFLLFLIFLWGFLHVLPFFCLHKYKLIALKFKFDTVFHVHTTVSVENKTLDIFILLEKTVQLIVFSILIVVGPPKESTPVSLVFLARGLWRNLVGSGYHDNSRVSK